MCNNKRGDTLPAMCFISVYDRFTTEFIEIMNLQTDFSPPTKIETGQGRCEENEVLDELFVCSLIHICIHFDD